MVLDAGIVARSHARARDPVRAAPLRADRLCLPDARFAVRGRGRRPGDVHPGLARIRPLRGPGRRQVVALPHHHERLPRHAERPGAPRHADGSRPGARADRVEPERADRGDLDPADPRSRRRRRRPRDDSARIRRGAPASAAASARRADPLRGPALAGDRGGRAARDERRVGEQRAAAGSRDARRERRHACGRRRPSSTRRIARCSRATSRRSSSTTSRR